MIEAGRLSSHDGGGAVTAGADGDGGTADAGTAGVELEVVRGELPVFGGACRTRGRVRKERNCPLSGESATRVELVHGKAKERRGRDAMPRWDMEGCIHVGR